MRAWRLSRSRSADPRQGHSPDHRISIAGPRKGTSCGIPDFLSHDTDRWALHLLPRGRPPRRADASPTARTPLFIADVRAALRPAFRWLPPCRARLPGLRTQRLAGPENLRVYVRSLRPDHKSLHRSARALALHAVHAGLRRPRGFSHGLGPSGADRGAHRPGRGGPQRRPGGQLEAAACFRGPSARPTKARFAPISCRGPRRGRAMSATIPTWNAMTRICGPMNVPFSTSPARPTFKATCSTTIEPM